MWAGNGAAAARLGLGEEAYRFFVKSITNNQRHASGLTGDGNGVMEAIGFHVTGMNEALMQSYDGLIRVFPAVPSQQDFHGRLTLLASGGFMVSSEYEAREVKYVGLKSLYGNDVAIQNPWPTSAVNLRSYPGGQLVPATVSDGRISFPTSANGIYVVEQQDEAQDHRARSSQGAFCKRAIRVMRHRKPFP
jgi:hypothetical protein